VDLPQQSSPVRKVHVTTFVHDDTTVEKPLEAITLPDTGSNIGLKPKRIVRYGPLKPLQRSTVLRTYGEISLRAMTGIMSRDIARYNYGTGMIGTAIDIQYHYS
jgi:hypothetical protein